MSFSAKQFAVKQALVNWSEEHQVSLQWAAEAMNLNDKPLYGPTIDPDNSGWKVLGTTAAKACKLLLGNMTCGKCEGIEKQYLHSGAFVIDSGGIAFTGIETNASLAYSKPVAWDGGVKPSPKKEKIILNEGDQVIILAGESLSISLPEGTSYVVVRGSNKKIS